MFCTRWGHRDRARHCTGPHPAGSCYCACLTKAAEAGLESIAFCCISTGVFCFPNEDAAEIAVQTVKEFLQTPTTIKKVIFNVFKDLDKEIYTRLLTA